MKGSNRVRGVAWVVAFAGAFVLAGPSIAQDLRGAASSTGIEGLQLTVRLDQSQGTDPSHPKFQVQLRNDGENNLILNIGTFAGDGQEQYASAISLILLTSGGKPQFLSFLRPLQDTGGRLQPLLLPLPSGASFSIPVDLANYRAAGSNNRFYGLKAGTYLIAARFIGSNAVAPPGNFPLAPSRLLPVTEQPFDSVGHAVGSTSAFLRFEVPTR